MATTYIRGASAGCPNAKIEATCAPVAPPPMTNIDGGNAVRLQVSLWVAVNSKPGTASRRLVPPAQRMILSACARSPANRSGNLWTCYQPPRRIVTSTTRRRAHFLLHKRLTFNILPENWSGRRDSNPRPLEPHSSVSGS
jgi:hypothetical protein